MPTTVQELGALANALAPEIDKHMPEDVSFSLFIYNAETRDGVQPEPENNNIYHISGTKRVSVVAMVKIWLDAQLYGKANG